LRQRRAFVRSSLTRTTQKFARHRLLKIMSSRDRDGVSTNQTSSTDMRYEMGFGAGLFSEIQKRRIHEDHG
jgi:hypothetical protein